MRRLAIIMGIMAWTSASILAGSSSVVFNVYDHGAAGDGKTVDTDAINTAIEKCSKMGGGTVYFPAGTYLSGSIRLKSNITLHLDNGATILGASNKLGLYDHWDENPWPYQDFGHSHWKCSLIWGIGLTNIAIVGQGTIDGSGMTRGDPKKPGEGDKAIGLKLCKNVLLKDFTIVNGGHFAVLPTGVDNMVIDNVTVDTNRDGINLDCCRNVRMSNCSINSPRDDGICLKSSYGLGFKRVTENVTIVNCMVSGYPQGTLVDGTYSRAKTRNEGCGGIKFGTESNGGFKNVTIANCVFDKGAGFSLEIVDGGVMENINISGIVMRDVTSAPIFIRLGNRARGPKETTAVGTVRNIRIDNVTVVGSWENGASSITGFPGHRVENVRLSNISILCDGGGTKEDAKRLVPINPRSYPRSDMFGKLPVYGFYCRFVDGLEFHNVHVGFKNDDMRSALIAEAVDGLELDNFTFQYAEGGADPVKLYSVKDLFVHDCRELKQEMLERAVGWPEGEEPE